MTTAIATKSDSTLDTLAGEIDQAHAAAQAAATTAIEHARRAGELLLAAKASPAHGRFLPWLAENVIVSERQAQRYMRVAEKWDTLASSNPTRVSEISLRNALELLAPPAEESIEDEITEKTGLSGTEFKQAKAVVEAAKREPDRYGDLPKTMDETGDIGAAHEELQRRRSATRKPRPEPEWLKSIEMERVESVISDVIKGWQGRRFTSLITALKGWIKRMEDEDAARAVEVER